MTAAQLRVCSRIWKSTHLSCILGFATPPYTELGTRIYAIINYHCFRAGSVTWFGNSVETPISGLNWHKSNLAYQRANSEIEAGFERRRWWSGSKKALVDRVCRVFTGRIQKSWFLSRSIHTLSSQMVDGCWRKHDVISCCFEPKWNGWKTIRFEFLRTRRSNENELGAVVTPWIIDRHAFSSKGKLSSWRDNYWTAFSLPRLLRLSNFRGNGIKSHLLSELCTLIIIYLQLSDRRRLR